MDNYQADIKNVVFYDSEIGAIVKDFGFWVMPEAKFSQTCEMVYCDKDQIYEISFNDLQRVMNENPIWPGSPDSLHQQNEIIRCGQNIQSTIEKLAHELFGEMRYLTKEEQENYQSYLEQISVPTGFNINDFI